jgi:hypothetical protein
MTSNTQAAYRAKFYQAAADQWKSAGEFIRGDLTHILRKTPGKFLGGADRPGEADCEWLCGVVDLEFHGLVVRPC